MITNFNGISQLSLIVSILAELDRQKPGITLDPAQFNVMIRAANLIVDAVNTFDPPASPDRQGSK